MNKHIAPAALAGLALVALTGCLYDPSPPLIDSTTPAITTGATTGGSQAQPLDPEHYTSQPVPTGLLGDMLKMGGMLYEPYNNWWNTRVDKAPLDPNSASIIATIRSYESNGAQLHPDFSPSDGMPYVIVDAETPLVPVSFGDPSESDAGIPGGPAGYPIPADAINNPQNYIENGGRSDGDRHLLIFDKDHRAAFELVQAGYTNGTWSAGYGAVFKLDTNYTRPDTWTSADASGLCILAGLVRYDEVYGPWPIRHALRVSLRHTNGHVYPASHTGAEDAGAPPLGTRLRLKQSYDISKYPPHMRKILNAMKAYGLIVADRGTSMYVQGTMDARWDNSVLNPVFHDMDVNDFEVIQLGWKPGTPQP
jgi:hypothetical protein